MISRIYFICFVDVILGLQDRKTSTVRYIEHFQAVSIVTEEAVSEEAIPSKYMKVIRASL